MLTKKENDILEAIEDAIKKQVLTTQNLNTLSDRNTLDCMARILERICRIKAAYKNTERDPEAGKFMIKQERRKDCEGLDDQDREALILRYESEIRQLTHRVEKLKAGASPADVIF